MKTLITITAHGYTGKNHKIAFPERTFHFIRPSSADKPTYLGAARMVAKCMSTKPSNVSVARVEACCYQAK